MEKGRSISVEAGLKSRTLFMKRHPFPLAALILAVALFSVSQRAAHATATANSQLSFTNLAIIPSAGTLSFLTNWTASAYAQAGPANQFNSGTGQQSANAAGDYSLAHGDAAGWTPMGLNVSGSAKASASVPGQIMASDDAAGRGAVNSLFMITGGTGSVNTLFSLNVGGSLNVFTDTYGESAEAETILSLELNGSPTLFDNQLLSIGPNDFNSITFSHGLNNSVALQYNTVYSIWLVGDAEARVSNIPEPNPAALALAGLAALWAGRRGWRQRLRARTPAHAKRLECAVSRRSPPRCPPLVKIALKRRGISRPRLTSASRTAAAMLATALLWGANVSYATYIGSDPPDQCKECACRCTREPGGNARTSLTEGNLREDYQVVSVKGGVGATLTLGLTYNSYNADGSRAQVDTGLGFGWTHSYNVFLFQQRSHLFRMDADGRVTQYHFNGGGVYTADPGYFETITPQLDGSYFITNKFQSWWHFALVPNTPYLVAGPIYRLIEMGDRNQNVTSLTYSNGLLVQITDPYARALMLAYTNSSKLATITDPLGRTTLIQYDSLFRVPVRVTDPDGKVIRYSYNSLYQLNRKIDRDGRTYFYTYKNKKPSAVLDGLGQTWFSLANSNNWAVDRNTLALSLRRQYLPGTAAKTNGFGNVWNYTYDTNGYITRIVAPDGATTSYTYDAATRLISSATNANGAVTRYQYDAQGNRTNVTDALGNVTTYTYEPVFNQMTSMTDPNGRITTYQYDSRGNRTNEVDALGQSTRYTYDSRGNLLTQTDRRGNTTTYIYDSSGNRTNMTDALGDTTTYGYDANGNRTRVTDADGNVTTYQYDARDRVVGVTNALGGITTTIYDGRDRVTRTTDPNTNSTSYGYDTRGRLAQTTNALGGVTTHSYDADNNRIATTDELGRITTYFYDSRDRLVRTTNTLGGVSSSAYDPVGNVITDTDPNGHSTSYMYDALDRRVTTTDPLGGVTRYDYAMPGGPPCCSPTIGSALVTRLEDANGRVTFYRYDELDRLKQVVRKEGDTNDVADASDAVTTYTYDPNGNRVTMTDPVTNITTYTYDAVNRLVLTTNAAGDVTACTYDPVGNRLTTTEPNGNITTNIYDGLNRLVAARDQAGLISSYGYDPVGNRLTATDGNTNTTAYAYDALNRLITTTDRLGNSTTYSYDPVGNLVTNVDRIGRITMYMYDGLNRPTSMVDALGNTTTHSYDAVGNQTAMTDPNGHTTTYMYDALDRRVVETYPDPPPNSRTNVYDAVGNLISRTDQRGQVTTYSYNDLYFLTNRNYQPSGINDRFTYDLSGRMLSAERAGWVDTFAYDGASRLITTTQNGQTVGYVYDIPGRTLSTAYPGGRTITVTNDARGRQLSIHDGTPNPPIATYTYDGADRVVRRAFRNGAVANYSYNANNWITSLEHSNGLNRIVGFGYTYDNEGNKRFEEKRHAPADSEAYRYDALYRLTNFDVGMLSGSTIPAPTLEKTWNLDPVGNWNSVTSNSVPQARTHNSVNELTSINATNLLSYDDDGNLQQDPAYSYSYDEENRLSQVVRLSDSALVGQYFYDALGRRIVRILNPAGTPATNVFFYDGVRIIEDRTAGGAILATYTYGDYVDEVLTMDRAGQTYYYHQNALWTPQALTDGTGAVAERYAYDAYGCVTVLNAGYAPLALNAWGTPHSAVTNLFLFTGRELDEETGLYFYRARSFDCGLGRFLQRDPLEYADGLNLYEYVHGRPTFSVDPSGLAQSLTFESNLGGPTFGNCGEIAWVVRWELAEASGKGGHIVQFITFDWKVTNCEDQPIPMPGGTNGPLAQSPLSYWEAWPVARNATVGAPTEDQWLWKDFGKCTRGRVSIKGKARYYEGLTSLPGSFIPWNRKTLALSLRSVTDAAVPDVYRRTFNAATPGTPPVERELVFKWDCCPDEKPTEILSRKP